MEDFFDMNEGQINPLDELQDSQMLNINDYNDDSLGGFFHHKGLSPFDSGFDADHPMPTYEQLRNAGFSDYLAHNITSGLFHSYSERELFHCFYESEDPLKAYNEMMEAKVHDSIAKTDKALRDIESIYGV